MYSCFISVPTLLFDHQRAGSQIRVSRDGRKTARATYAAHLLDDHYPQAENELHHANNVLGNIHMTDGRLYWEVETLRTAGGWCSSIFGVTSSVMQEGGVPGRDSATWAVHLQDDATTNIRMMHADQCLHEEVCGVIGQRKQHTHRYGLLMDIENRWLSVIDVKGRNSLYTFTNVDTSRGVWPIVAVYKKCTVRLVDPDEIPDAPLLPFCSFVL